MPFRPPELPTVGAAFLRTLAIDEHPYVAEHVEQHLAATPGGGGGDFEFGLDLILDGLERLRRAWR